MWGMLSTSVGQTAAQREEGGPGRVAKRRRLRSQCDPCKWNAPTTPVTSFSFQICTSSGYLRELLHEGHMRGIESTESK